MLMKSTFFFGWIVIIACSYSNEHRSDIPQNDFSTLVNDLRKILHLDEALEVIRQYFETAIQNGQNYSYVQFRKDWSNLQFHPIEIAQFVHRSIWSAIVHASLAVIELFLYFHQFFLHFLKNKCDIYLGKADPYHPWNIMDQGNKQAPLYVFIYGGILSIILMKFLSSWNFMLYIAVSFLVHYIGGTQLVFKWILCIIGVLWFAFEIITSYPLHAAVTVVVLYLSSFIFPWIIAKGTPERIYVRSSPETFRQNEIKALHSRINNMEEKTCLINKKLEQLYALIEKQENVENE